MLPGSCITQSILSSNDYRRASPVVIEKRNNPAAVAVASIDNQPVVGKSHIKPTDLSRKFNCMELYSTVYVKFSSANTDLMWQR